MTTYRPSLNGVPEGIVPLENGAAFYYHHGNTSSGTAPACKSGS